MLYANYQTTGQKPIPRHYEMRDRPKDRDCPRECPVSAFFPRPRLPSLILGANMSGIIEQSAIDFALLDSWIDEVTFGAPVSYFHFTIQDIKDDETRHACLVWVLIYLNM